VREFDERAVIGRHARRRDDVQLGTDGGEDVGLEHALYDHDPSVGRKIGEMEPEMEWAPEPVPCGRSEKESQRYRSPVFMPNGSRIWQA